MGDKLRATKDELRRLVVAEWWKWMPGMLFEPAGLTDEMRAQIGDDLDWIRARVKPEGLLRPEIWLPVVSDDATAGCLLQLYLRRYAAEHEGVSASQALVSLATVYALDEYASLGDVLVKALLEVGVCWTYRPEGNPLTAKQHPACPREGADAGPRSPTHEPESSAANPSSGRAPR
jgi:hypothetical protein